MNKKLYSIICIDNFLFIHEIKSCSKCLQKKMFLEFYLKSRSLCWHTYIIFFSKTWHSDKGCKRVLDLKAIQQKEREF